jgi:hypothetical protein
MKMRIALTALTLLVLSAGQHRVHAIEDLQLQIQGTNAVLSWPSTQNETFIVRYRARLDEAHPWTILTNGYPAAWGGNRPCSPMSAWSSIPPAVVAEGEVAVILPLRKELPVAKTTAIPKR